MGRLIVGTRGSALALAQTELVCAALRRAHPGAEVQVACISTTGDQRADVPLSQLGRGVFVTEIETALRAGHIDVAVHSAKDLPSTLAPDLTIAAFLPREDARDVVVSRHGPLRKLPAGARVGTSSPRRACLLRAMRPDLDPVDIRGNVDTRLRKLEAGEFDAIILAAAGLTRLSRTAVITQWLDPDVMIPSVGQGALAVQTRANDETVTALLRALDNDRTRQAVTAERAFLAELGAGCRAAAGAHATVMDKRIRMTAFIGAPDGRHVRARSEHDATAAVELGRSLAMRLLLDGGAAFLGRADGPLRGRRIAVTRSETQAAGLSALLRAHGAEPVPCPTIAIEPADDRSAIDRAVRDLASADWLVFTSSNAVEALSRNLARIGRRVPDHVRLAAVGDATAEAVRATLRPPDFVPGIATAEALARGLPVSAGALVLFPHGNLVRNNLLSALRERGVRTRAFVVYRTVAGPGAARLADEIRTGTLDAVVFTSPSTVSFASAAVEAMVSQGDRAPAVACIGSATGAAARSAGLQHAVEADAATVGSIVEALERALARVDQVTGPAR